MIPVVIGVVVLVLVGVYLYAHAKTRWDIEAFPYDVLEVREDPGIVTYRVHGEVKQMTVMLTFDYDVSPLCTRHCYLACTNEDVKRRHTYVFTSQDASGGPYSYELDEKLRKLVQDVIVEALASPENNA